jgi:hypothetical protein
MKHPIHRTLNFKGLADILLSVFESLSSCKMLNVLKMSSDQVVKCNNLVASRKQMLADM